MPADLHSITRSSPLACSPCSTATQQPSAEFSAASRVSQEQMTTMPQGPSEGATATSGFTNGSVAIVLRRRGSPPDGSDDSSFDAGNVVRRARWRSDDGCTGTSKNVGVTIVPAVPPPPQICQLGRSASHDSKRLRSGLTDCHCFSLTFKASSRFWECSKWRLSSGEFHAWQMEAGKFDAFPD